MTITTHITYTLLVDKCAYLIHGPSTETVTVTLMSCSTMYTLVAIVQAHTRVYGHSQGHGHGHCMFIKHVYISNCIPRILINKVESFLYRRVIEDLKWDGLII